MCATALFSLTRAAPTGIYTLSLHDALPICAMRSSSVSSMDPSYEQGLEALLVRWIQDRESTRLNSSHSSISYAVFCLKKKKIDARDGSAGIHDGHLNVRLRRPLARPGGTSC